jgi:RHS repeat-associated protein
MMQYKFTGKLEQRGNPDYSGELDQETGLYYYGARYYDPQISMWYGVDTMAHVRVSWSPYNAFRDNPILNIDPNGALDSPVFDTEGSLLGTDDQGLQGKAIVMDKKDFKQGMKHDDALKKNLGASGLKTDQAKKNFSQTYSSLSSRPDYDGKITLGEANAWYRNSGGKPLFADLSKIDIDITSKEFSKIGETKLSSTNGSDFLVYGTITVGNLGNNQVSSKYDIYDFDMHYNSSTNPNVGGRIKENAKRWFEIC